MTLFEWRYEKGWIWISEDRNKSDRNPAEYVVTVDPAGWGDHYASLDAEERVNPRCLGNDEFHKRWGKRDLKPYLPKGYPNPMRVMQHH